MLNAATRSGRFEMVAKRRSQTTTPMLRRHDE